MRKRGIGKAGRGCPGEWGLAAALRAGGMDQVHRVWGPGSRGCHPAPAVSMHLPCVEAATGAPRDQSPGTIRAAAGPELSVGRCL